MGLIPLITIPGTHNWSPEKTGQWWTPESPWWAYMRSLGFVPAGSRPYIWTTYLNGWQFWRRWLRSTRVDHHDWICAAQHLVTYVQAWDLTPEQTHIVAHSHGAQVVLYACAYFDLRVATLTTVCSPIRADVQPNAKIAVDHIGFWQHVYSPDWSDRYQVWGGLADGHLGIERRQPFADKNHPFPSIGHSGILQEPKLFPVWRDLADLIRPHHGPIHPPPQTEALGYGET